MEQPSDAQCVEEALLGNRQAYGVLYERYFRLVLANWHSFVSQLRSRKTAASVTIVSCPKSVMRRLSRYRSGVSRVRN